MKEDLENIIYSLEEKLLESDTRRSAEKIAELLSEDFFEFCSSGNIWYYNVNDIIDSNVNENTIKWEIKDFKVKLLADGLVLATYKVIKNDKKIAEKKYSLRSSIWKYLNGKWKMVFHQGTQTKKL